MIKLTIVVPIYKVEQYLDQCIESIVNQSYQNLEIILVDDGSPDRCPQICDRWARRDQRITVIHQENKGLSEARNVGIRIATGDYITFIDSDDYYQDLGFLETVCTQHLKQYVDMICFNAHEERMYSEDIRNTSDFQEVFVKLTDVTYFEVNAWCKIVKRDIIINNELYFKKGIVCEDFEWTYHLIFYIDTVRVLSDKPIYYRNNPGSIMHNINSKMVNDMLDSLQGRVTYIQQLEQGPFQAHLMYMMAREFYSILWMVSFLNKLERKSFYGDIKSWKWLVAYGNPKLHRKNRVVFYIFGMRGYMLLLMVKRKYERIIVRCRERKTH